MDISQLIAPDSDEMVAADLIGSPPQVFVIAEVNETVREKGKRVANIRLEGFPRPWRPGKGMSRVMADNWGRETQDWIGKRVELYGDPEVYFGKEKTGGVRISRLSHISAPRTTRINPRGGNGSSWTVQPLPDAPAPSVEPTPDELAAMIASGIKDSTTEAEIREWGNRAHARGLLDIQVEGQVLRDHVTAALAALAQEAGADA